MDFLNELNEPQRQAAEHIEGPAMVIAGAGSGKTRVLTYRIANLVHKGVDPFNILSLTFTNKAAREMKSRIAAIIGEGEARNLWMGTFHSVFARILRFEGEKLGYPSNFTIYDTADAKNLLKTIIKEMKLDDKVYKPNLVLNRISSAKNSLVSAEEYCQDTQIQSDDYQSRKPEIGNIYKRYSARCFKSGAMDFDDLLFNTNLLLENHPDVLHKYQMKFRYILVDEYQDTNFSQYRILKKLGAKFENICVVGDDAQSIYSFRGANIENILNFQKDYNDAKVFKLEQNYRSTKVIVGAANSIIKRNKGQLHKEVWTSNQAGGKIKILRTLTDNEEGRTVANQIFEIQNQFQAHHKDFAILYRTNAQSRAMEEALRKLNIPYKIYGGLSFYQRKEVKDLVSYFRMAVNPQDEEALKRIINYPTRGIGNTTIDKIIVAANEKNASLWEVVSQPNEHNLQVNSGTYNRIQDFATMIKSFQVMLNEKNAFDTGSYIAKSSGLLKELYNDKSPEGLSRYENIQELLNALKEFTEETTSDEEDTTQDELLEQKNTLDAFLQDIALLTDQDNNKKDEDNNKVLLMTVHAAKGLEFPYVFVTGLEENLFPSQLSLNDRNDLEEERRLFYVALTRAEKQVFLTYAESRYKWGNLNFSEPSRFLEEIDEQFIETTYIQTTPFQRTQQKPKANNQYGGHKSKTATKSFGTTSPNKQTLSKQATERRKLLKLNSQSAASNFTGDDTSNLQVGMQVQHQRFGKGKVVNIEGQKATVFFQGFGQKQLLLKFAKLQILN